MCMYIFLDFFKETATTEIYTYLHTLSLRDALPIFVVAVADDRRVQPPYAQRTQRGHADALAGVEAVRLRGAHVVQQAVAGRAHQHRQALADVQHHQFRLALPRLEEHTSELQSLIRIS